MKDDDIRSIKRFMIRYHIPDFQRNLRLNSVFCKYFEINRDLFSDNINIEYIYDSFPTVWNGGRLKRGTTDPDQVKATLRQIRNMGLAVAYTFTNSLLTEEHLKNETANAIMKLTSDIDMKKSVILNSGLLEQYIRENYPDFSIILSTTRQLRTASEINRALEDDYELVVIDYNMNHAMDELELIRDRSRCELLINACCRDECPERTEHYRAISEFQIMNEDPEKRCLITNRGCTYGKNSYFQARNNRNFIEAEEIRRIYEPLGFEHMKIEGRDGDMLNLLEQYVQYMAKPEYRDRVRFELLHFLI